MFDLKVCHFLLRHSQVGWAGGQAASTEKKLGRVKQAGVAAVSSDRFGDIRNGLITESALRKNGISRTAYKLFRYGEANR